MTIVEHPFRLARPDGAQLRGEVRLPEGEPPTTAVVVLHGFKGFRRWGFFPRVAERLAEAGHAAVTFDFSRNGVGPGGEDFDDLEGFARNTLSRELAEALRVMEAVREGALPLDPPERLALFGHSRGGGIAVLAADEGGADALVTWAAVATFDRWSEAVKEEWRRRGRHWVANARTGQDMPLNLTLLEDFEANRDRLDVEAAAARIRVPWLIVHGEADEAVAPDDARRLERASPTGKLAIIADAGHTFGASHPFEAEGPLLREAIERSLEHLEEAPRGR